ncbi:MAG: hypothetical protein JHD07_22570 [Bradyrhizobium sp.]|uniref:hypothetical protein n=1 Tax=Bradyrhizobium sp. TaxID=376 RepID=UPI001A225ABE|nr:hypothetical protein [Bradyrhizobium sp.]MBJ7405942.1 hypothetical protein [Bradyrhizobium sp.]
MVGVQLSRSEIQRAAELRWRNVPAGIPAVLAEVFMNRLRGGSTIRKLTGGGQLGPALVSYKRFKRHCELHPRWGAEAWRLSDINGRFGKGARLRGLTRCHLGHSLSDALVYWQNGYIKRDCRTCRRLRRDNATMTQEAVKRVTAAIQNGVTVSQIIHGVPAGGGRRDPALVLVHPPAFYRYRRENPKFEALVQDAISARRHRPREFAQLNTFTYRYTPGDEAVIRQMLPGWLTTKDDVVNDIMILLFEGRVDRAQVPALANYFANQHSGQFPTRFAKFGNSPLLSLDEALFDDGSGTVGDKVTRGLWD